MNDEALYEVNLRVTTKKAMWSTNFDKSYILLVK